MVPTVMATLEPAGKYLLFKSGAVCLRTGQSEVQVTHVREFSEPTQAASVLKGQRFPSLRSQVLVPLLSSTGLFFWPLTRSPCGATTPQRRPLTEI